MRKNVGQASVSESKRCIVVDGNVTLICEKMARVWFQNGGTTKAKYCKDERKTMKETILDILLCFVHLF